MDIVGRKIMSTLFVIFIIAGIIYVQLGTKAKQREREWLYQYGNFAIGEVSGIPKASVGKSVSTSIRGVVFFFYINGNKFIILDGYGFLDEKESKNESSATYAEKGQKYLVLYRSDDPNKAIMRLDYPIKDSIDFQRYVKEFELRRKTKNKNIWPT